MFRSRGFVSAVALVWAAAVSACGADPTPTSTKQSALGEGCVKSADCSGKLVCIAGSCALPGAVADAEVTSDIAPDSAGPDLMSVDAGVDAADASDSSDAVDVSAADSSDTVDSAVAPDVCDPTCPAGGCVSSCGTPCSGTCSDNNACTTGDTCQNGKCAGQVVLCDDKNPCTDDACDPSSGCKHTPNAAGCDDDNPCTVGDICNSGTCASGQAKTCASGDPCVIGKCSITSGGKCTFTDASDGTGCDDGSVCTAGDACKSGACSGIKVDCDDKNSCTVDVCDSKAGCVHQEFSGPCADGDGCTEADSCKGGSCQAGPAKLCDDGAPCTKDTCNKATGLCANAAAPLDGTVCDADGSACTVGDVCSAGLCAAGKNANCDDGNACTTDACDVKLGCQNPATAGPCNADDSACTVDTCTSGKCAAGTPKACNDNNVCTSDTCDPKTGQCGYTGLPDGTTCDANAAAGCKPVQCKSQACVPSAPPNCDDGNICTIDACTDSACLPGAPGCVPKAKCMYASAPGACDVDGSVCTVSDTCSDGACMAGKLNACDDSNPCTDDACDAKTGCAHTPNAAACTDGDPCTADTCVAAKCVSTAVPCDPCLALGGTVATVGAAVRVCSGKIGEAKIKDYKIYGGWKACTIPDMVALTKVGDNYTQLAWTNTPCTTNNQPGHMIYKHNSGWGVFDLNSTDSYSCSSDYCCGYGPSQLLICKP